MLIPALTILYANYMLARKDGAVIPDDGFRLGLVYILRINKEIELF